MGTATARLMNLPDVEVIFQAFVRNANAVAAQARTSQAPPRAPSAPPPLAVSLGDFAAGTPSAPIDAQLHAEIEAQLDSDLRSEGALPVELGETSHILGDLAALEEESAEPVELVRKKVDEQTMPELDPGPGSTTQRLEAEKVVPDVASVAPPPAPVREGSELGEIPPRELERTMADMQVLLRYGHKAEVGRRLDELHTKYPEDLLLLRRIAEFHVQTGSLEAAKECLFKLATVLFERRNVVGMRSALEQVLVLEPRNPRAHRLLSLLERR